MKARSNVGRLIDAEIGQERLRLRTAAAAGAIVAAAAVGLLGLSGWFITGAALAGAGGAVAVKTFNYLTPSAAIRLFAILRTVSRYVERVAGHEAALAALARLRPLLFAAFAAGPPERALNLSAGEASARLVEDVEAVQTLFIRRSAPFALGAGAIASAGLALLVGPGVAVAVVVAMALSVAGGLWIARRLAGPAGARVQEAMGGLKATAAALGAGAPELRAYGLEDWAELRVNAAAAQLEAARRDVRDAEGRALAWQSACLGVGVAGAILLAVLAGAPQPMVALAALVALTGVESAGALVQALILNGAARAGLRRLDDLSEVEAPTRGQVPDGHRLQLAGFATALTPPFRLALSGRSGCGKTSWLERLLRLRAPLPGEMSIGATPLEHADVGGVRALFAYGPQHMRLLDGSVRDNLRLAAPDATDDEMWAVLTDACLADRVRAAPAGLDLDVGPNGAHLSGGERRRLSLARAYLRPAPWLVLDEPTEGLDAATETAVLEALDARLERTGQGLILVTHRAAAARICGMVATARRSASGGPLRFDLRELESA
ncbi:ATP-binding cassette domain-containing protein [Brevundimonas sp.]|uniref:amino acid ABC transporter ATP-binding/permease protein n=1 Tax=Brevundimonas sp. TaxID=1871086 RepID=UPI002622CAA6|nr:ATP-binding cassette domain-containing protein [Brevundimonas sp.]